MGKICWVRLFVGQLAYLLQLGPQRLLRRVTLLVSALVAELGLNGGVVGVLLAHEPKGGEIVEGKVADDRVGDLGGVEAVHGLDELVAGAGIAGKSLVEDVSCIGDLDIGDLVLCVGDDLGDLSIEAGCDLPGSVADGIVGVHPPPAGTDLEAVEVVVEVSVGDVVVVLAEGMVAGMHGVVEDAAIDKGDEGDGRAVGQLLISHQDGIDKGLVVLGGGSHGVEGVVAVADIVADHREDGGDGLVGGAAGKKLNPLDKFGSAGTVDTQVLVVAVVATVELVEAGVDADHGAGDAGGVVGHVGVSSAPGKHGPVSLVLDEGEEVGEGCGVHLGDAENIRGDAEVGGGRVAEDGNAHGLGASAVQLLVGLAGGGVGSDDAVAVGIDECLAGVGGGVAAGVDSRIDVVAVLATPVASAKGGLGGEVVAVGVGEGEVVLDVAHAGDDGADVEGAQVLGAGHGMADLLAPLLDVGEVGFLAVRLSVEGGGAQLAAGEIGGGEQAADAGLGFAHSKGVADGVRALLVDHHLTNRGDQLVDSNIADVLQKAGEEAAEGGEGGLGVLVTELHGLLAEGNNKGANGAFTSTVGGGVGGRGPDEGECGGNHSRNQNGAGHDTNTNEGRMSSDTLRMSSGNVQNVNEQT